MLTTFRNSTSLTLFRRRNDDCGFEASRIVSTRNNCVNSNKPFELTLFLNGFQWLHLMIFLIFFLFFPHAYHRLTWVIFWIFKKSRLTVCRQKLNSIARWVAFISFIKIRKGFKTVPCFKSIYSIQILSTVSQCSKKKKQKPHPKD